MQKTFRPLLKRAAIIAVLVGLGTGGWYGWNLVRNISQTTGTTSPIKLVSSLMGTTLQTTAGRTNILVAGYSADDSGHQGASLTDSIMVVSIDQSTKSAVVVSIPRDLYVTIPGYGYAKINEAYADGQDGGFSQTSYASGGMGLLEKTIEQSLGIHSDYEALVNYTAFKDLVNAVGGVNVTIASSNPRGLYDPNTDLDLPNGQVTLDGQQALNLARARGEGYGSYGFPNGDFTRTTHQQQILLALKAKVGSSLSPAEILNIAGALGNNVKTDLGLGELRTLYDILQGISTADIQTETLDNLNGQNMLVYYTTDSGQSALVPAAGLGNFTDIQSTLADTLTSE